MYAVIETGGKQYRVQPGQVLRVEKLAADAGEEVEFNKVLLTADGEEIKVGNPYLDGGSVKAKVRVQGRAKKINIIKFRRRKHSR
ncbi:MAG TPA: 50S ribosomal protein L21, partial [Gammaproteobacteria bacterium]|nr:50S ribosomal protein L21 [Gammaproteobacteria bacterium]